jgi:hypothetical protein
MDRPQKITFGKSARHKSQKDSGKQRQWSDTLGFIETNCVLVAADG